MFFHPLRGQAGWATGKTKLAEKPDLGPGMQPGPQEEAGHVESCCRTLEWPLSKDLGGEAGK